MTSRATPIKDDSFQLIEIERRKREEDERLQAVAETVARTREQIGQNQEEIAKQNARIAAADQNIRSIQSSNRNFKIVLVFLVIALVGVSGAVIFSSLKIWLKRS